MSNKTKIVVGIAIGIFGLALIALFFLLSGGKTYSVSFDSDGGSYATPLTVKDGEIISRPTDPVKEGYRFVRWELNGQEYDFRTPIKGDVKLVAVWEKIEEAPKYKLVFTVDGETKEIEVSDASEISLDELGFKEKEGYDIEWTLDGEKFDPTTPITEDMSITGKYVKVNYLTVKFSTNGGSKVDNQKVKSGEVVTEPTDVTKHGFILDGWYLSGKKYDFNTPVTKNITLTAKWKEDSSVPRYKVTFDSGDGGSKVSEQKVVENEKATEPKAPTRTGFKFIEWQLDGKKYDFKKEVTKDIKLVAKWEELQEFTVTFDTDGGSSVASQKVYDGSYAKEPTKPTKEGHTFKEWQLDGKKFEFKKTKITKDITLKAVWTKVEAQYTITATRADNYSPDSILKVFKNNQEITFTEIKYNDGVKLCGSKGVVSTNDIEGETSFIVVLNDGQEVKATRK